MFWANGLGAELGAKRGIGTIVLDVHRVRPHTKQNQWLISVAVNSDSWGLNEAADAAVAVTSRNLGHLRAGRQRLLDNASLVLPRPSSPALHPVKNFNPHRSTLRLALKPHA
jgi:hypothetical protein